MKSAKVSIVGEAAMEHKPRVKRQLEECEEGEEGGGEGEGGMEVEGGSDVNIVKKQREEEIEGRKMAVGGDEIDSSVQTLRPDFNFPLPSETGLPCLVKVYTCVPHLNIHHDDIIINMRIYLHLYVNV